MAGTKGSKYYDIFLRYHIWLTHEKKGDIIDHAKFRLLQLIDKKESLKAAANELGISYRKAWGDIKEAEQQLRFALVEKFRGGEKGGKTVLTDDGRKLIEAYQELTEEMESATKRITRKFFHKINQ